MNTYTIDEIIDRAGGPREVAKHFNISVQAIAQWRKVPNERLLDMAELADISLQAVILARRNNQETERLADE